MPHHRLVRLVKSRLLLAGALTLTSAFGVDTLRGPSEEAVYGVSSTSGLTRLSANTVTARSVRAAKTQDSHKAGLSASEEKEVEGTSQVRAEGEKPKLQRARPTVRTAKKAAPESESVEILEAPEPPEPDVPEAPPPPPPPRPPSPEAVDPVWASLAACESGGNWHIDTGNGYYGGLQFSIESWQGVGGQGYPHEHPSDVQIAMGERLKSLQGWNAWPVCARRLGLI